MADKGTRLSEIIDFLNQGPVLSDEVKQAFATILDAIERHTFVKTATVQDYFHDMLGQRLPENITVIPLASPCGESCKVVIDGAAEMVDTIRDHTRECQDVIRIASFVVGVQING